MYKEVKVKSLSYWSWVKLIFVSVLPVFSFIFICWALSESDGWYWVLTSISIVVGCFFSAAIAKFSMWVAHDSLRLEIDSD